MDNRELIDLVSRLLLGQFASYPSNTVYKVKLSNDKILFFRIEEDTPNLTGVYGSTGFGPAETDPDMGPFVVAITKEDVAAGDVIIDITGLVID